ncbi:MAG: hypothetical protein LCH74_03690 [Proteobacteria bacterium]|nr:hypothetical protein [Pseudomonadota bacterium]
MIFAAVALVLIILTLGWCARGDEAAKSSISTGSAKGDAIVLFKHVTAIGAPCDAAMTNVAKAADSGDPVAAYRAADRAENSCVTTGGDIKKLGIPASFDAKSRKSATDAIEACDASYLDKWIGARKLKDIIDGDTSISAQAELEDLTQSIQQGTMLCGGGLAAVAGSLGATDVDLGIAGGKK